MKTGADSQNRTVDPIITNALRPLTALQGHENPRGIHATTGRGRPPEAASGAGIGHSNADGLIPIEDAAAVWGVPADIARAAVIRNGGMDPVGSRDGAMVHGFEAEGQRAQMHRRLLPLLAAALLSACAPAETECEFRARIHADDAKAAEACRADSECSSKGYTFAALDLDADWLRENCAGTSVEALHTGVSK